MGLYTHLMENIFSLGELPLHPLFVHLPVIAVPVAALMTLVLALVPQWAPRWVVPAFIVSTLGTLGAGLAKMSGEALAEAKNLSEHAAPLAEHAQYGDLAVVASILLTGLLLIWAVAVHKPQLHSLLTSPKLLLALRVLLTLAALAALVTVVLAGHEGAVLVWIKEA
ncbi:MAG TPA: hypothetical protein DIS77_01605 [Rothia sp.]|nr:hypothetical protein [Rothia sp. (in: high G+C Gram-positive bacteria)]